MLQNDKIKQLQEAAEKDSNQKKKKKKKVLQNKGGYRNLWRKIEISAA